MRKFGFTNIYWFFKDLFRIEKNPRKNMFAMEWVVIAYLLFTMLIVFFTYTKIQNPESMIWGRIRIGVMTIALWAVYRMIPCRFTRFVRVAAQMALLSWWYPDIYEINSMFPNLDHLFAGWEQQLFGCQPALVFCHIIPSHIFSELMDMGYASYYPMIAAVTLYYFIWKYHEFERASFIILTSFFIYYVIFIMLPVTGPQFYYKAVGLDQITHGIFPNLHYYFSTHQECLASPGYQDGLFYHLVEDAKNAGERPIAAFPSSHVGISTVLMLLSVHSRNRKLLLCLLPFYLLLCCSTVYIQAHYLIDAIAGFVSAVVIYFALLYSTKRM